MSDLDSCPTSIPCGFCDASTALERHQVDDLSIGQGCCPACQRLVLSVAGPSVPVHTFLDWLDSFDFSGNEDLSRLASARSQANGLQGRRLD